MSSLRTDHDCLFVSFKKPHASVTSRTLSRWIQSLMADAGMDVERWLPHSTRAASSHHLTKSRGFDVLSICRLADWSKTSGTYEKFYKKYV